MHVHIHFRNAVTPSEMMDYEFARLLPYMVGDTNQDAPLGPGDYNSGDGPDSDNDFDREVHDGGPFNRCSSGEITTTSGFYCCLLRM